MDAFVFYFGFLGKWGDKVQSTNLVSMPSNHGIKAAVSSYGVG